MNRFSTKDNVKRIDLGDGDWIEIPAVVSYADMEAIQASKDDNILVAQSVIRRWNLVGDDGMQMPITPENCRRLDFRVLNMVLAELQEIMHVPKAPSTESAAPSEEAGNAQS